MEGPERAMPWLSGRNLTNSLVGPASLVPHCLRFLHPLSYVQGCPRLSSPAFVEIPTREPWSLFLFFLLVSLATIHALAAWSDLGSRPVTLSQVPKCGRIHRSQKGSQSHLKRIRMRNFSLDQVCNT